MTDNILTDDELDLNQEITDKAKRIRFTQSRFKKAHSEAQKELKEIEHSFDAYESDSWPKDIKRIRDAEKKPTGDVARFPNIIDVVSGNQRQNRTEGRAFAFERDDFKTAEFVNLYLKYRKQKQRIQHENSLGFQNGIICMRAHWEYFLKPNPNDGSLETIRRERPAKEVFIEKPYWEYDTSDSPGLFHAQWKDPEDVAAMYGLSKQERKGLEFRKKTETRVETTHVLDEYSFPSDEDPDIFFKSDLKQVRLVRHWRKRFRRSFRVVNLIDPTTIEDANLGLFESKSDAMRRAVSFLEEKEMEVNEDNIDLLINEEEEEFYSYHVTSGRVELEWVENWGDFVPFTHYFSYWANGRAHGLYGRLADEIKYANFIMAKLVERFGTIGWMPLMVEEDAIPEGQTFNTMMKNWKDGKAVKVADGAIGRNKIKVEQDHSLQSVGPMIAFVQFFFENMNEKVGANDPFRGVSPGANTAGVAIEKLQSKASAVVEPLFDNFRRTLKEGELMEIKMLLKAKEMRPLYTVLKMERIIGGMLASEKFDKTTKNLSDLLEVGEIATRDGVEEFTIEKILEQMKFIEYDVNIDEAVAVQTLGISILQTISQIAGAIGLPAPPDIMVDFLGFLGIPESIRNRWLEFLQNQPPQVPAGNTNNNAGGINA